MIPFALLAGCVCAGLAMVDVARRPGDPVAAVRIPVTGIWSAAWLTYGLNLVHFPAPDAGSLLVLSAACLGTLLMCPLGVSASPVTDVHRKDDRPVRALAVLLVVAVLLILWDLYFVVDLVSEHGLGAGMSQHRLDRGFKGGAWSVPGMEVLHAAVTAAGAVGFAYWLGSRLALGLVLTLFGGLAALFSTGRWDVVAYAVWLFAIYGFLSPRGPALLLKQAAVYAVLPVFFVAHGQLLGKVDLVTTLANSSATQRADAASNAVPVIQSGGLGASQVQTQAHAAAPKVDPVVCQRWEDGVANANQGFRDLSRVTRTIVLYFAGPMAALDRALCENRLADRVVLLYWPNKIMRVLGLRPPEQLAVVDPFLDIGIPFNNYTAIYPFLSEIGPAAGLAAWLVVGLAIGRLWALMLRFGGVPGIVAGSSILAMAIRTPWGNTFFDGTLLVWLAVAALPALAQLTDRLWPVSEASVARVSQ